MDSIEKHQRLQDARRRLRAQRQRAGQLRGRVVAISLIGFVLLWGVVFAQMATGNDPVLGDRSSVVAAPATGKHRAGAAETADTEELELQRAAEREAREAAELEAIELEPEPVTTSQS